MLNMGKNILLKCKRKKKKKDKYYLVKTFLTLSICRLYPTFYFRVILKLKKLYMHLNINAEKCSTILMCSHW